MFFVYFSGFLTLEVRFGNGAQNCTALGWIDNLDEYLANCDHDCCLYG